MSEPSGAIVARPMVARACGCLQEFQHYAVDKFRAQRQAKFQKTRCANCVAKLVEEQKAAAAALPKKGEAMQLLPTGTQMSISRKPDGTWSGTLVASGTSVESLGDGPQGLVVALARLWVATTGAKSTAPIATASKIAPPAPNKSAPAPGPSKFVPAGKK
jgi:hypothetical protein